MASMPVCLIMVLSTSLLSLDRSTAVLLAVLYDMIFSLLESW